MDVTLIKKITALSLTVAIAVCMLPFYSFAQSSSASKAASKKASQQLKVSTTQYGYWDKTRRMYFTFSYNTPADGVYYIRKNGGNWEKHTIYFSKSKKWSRQYVKGYAGDKFEMKAKVKNSSGKWSKYIRKTFKLTAIPEKAYLKDSAYMGDVDGHVSLAQYEKWLKNAGVPYMIFYQLASQDVLKNVYNVPENTVYFACPRYSPEDGWVTKQNDVGQRKHDDAVCIDTTDITTLCVWTTDKTKYPKREFLTNDERGVDALDDYWPIDNLTEQQQKDSYVVHTLVGDYVLNADSTADLTRELITHTKSGR
ncbi:MAG: hypothetical protein ACI4W2_02870 [Eubacterium sp.]